LINQISKDTPFGSESMEPEFVNEILASFENMSENTEISGHLTEASADTPVKPERNRTVDSIEKWTKSINALFTECAYLVDITQDEWIVYAYAPIYWSSVDDLGEMGYVLIEAGKEAHDLWGGRDAESWDEFLDNLPRTPDFIVEP